MNELQGVIVASVDKTWILNAVWLNNKYVFPVLSCRIVLEHFISWITLLAGCCVLLIPMMTMLWQGKELKK